MVSVLKLYPLGEQPQWSYGEPAARILWLPLLFCVVFVAHVRRQIDRHKGKAGFPVLRVFKTDDVLVPLGAGFQLEVLLEVAVVHFDLAILVIVAAQAFPSHRGGADGYMVLAGEYVPKSGQSLLVEGSYLLSAVRCAVGDCLDAQLPFTKAKVNIR